MEWIIIALHFWEPRSDLTFNSTMILSAQDLDVAVITPIRVPGISDQPVRNVVLNAPAQQTNGMATQRFSMDVLIDTCITSINQ